MPPPEVVGVSQPAASLAGVLLGLIFLVAVILLVDTVWLAAASCLAFGTLLLLPGALLIRY